jgi:hypothetical protein
MCIQGFGGETWGEREHMEEQCVDGRITLRWIFRKWDVDWIEMVQDRYR